MKSSEIKPSKVQMMIEGLPTVLLRRVRVDHRGSGHVSWKLELAGTTYRPSPGDQRPSSKTAL